MTSKMQFRDAAADNVHAGRKNICLAIHMPNDTVELIINQSIEAKSTYIAQAYDDDLRLRSNPNIYIVDYMFY